VSYLEKRRIVLNNKYQDEEDNTSWSVDYCRSKEIIAVGSNSNRISFWYLKDIKRAMKYNKEVERHTILAHDHNVPCISFSPCGEFIASISID